MSNTELLRCLAPRCDDFVMNNKFAKIRAHERGWFFSKTRPGVIWCPEHLPQYVRDRRARGDDKFGRG